MIYVNLKMIEFTVPLNEQRVAVYCPPQPISRFCAEAKGVTHPDIYADFVATELLAPWASLVTMTKDAIVWLPKSGDEPRWLSEAVPACDLVLSHHARQLKPADWKTARRYAKEGRPRTISVPMPDIAERRWKGELRPYERPLTIHLDARSNTEFVAGEERVFQGMYEVFLGFGEGCITGDHNHISPKNWDKEDLTITLIVPEDWKPANPL